MKYTLKYTDPAGITTDIEFTGDVKAVEKKIAQLESKGGMVGTIEREDGCKFFKIGPLSSKE